MSGANRNLASRILGSRAFSSLPSRRIAIRRKVRGARGWIHADRINFGVLDSFGAGGDRGSACARGDQAEKRSRPSLRPAPDAHAIDRYKDAADKNLIQVKAGTEGYPPDLDTLVKGVQLTGAKSEHVRFLREIPKDPMTGTADWGMRSVQDDTDTTSWGGQDVFDVYSKSTGTALDGTKYSDW